MSDRRLAGVIEILNPQDDRTEGLPGLKEPMRRSSILQRELGGWLRPQPTFAERIEERGCHVLEG